MTMLFLPLITLSIREYNHDCHHRHCEASVVKIDHFHFRWNSSGHSPVVIVMRPNPWEAEWTGRGCSKDKVHEAFKCLSNWTSADAWCHHVAGQKCIITASFLHIYLLSVQMLSWYNMKICEVLVCDIFLAVLFFKCLQPFVGISKGPFDPPLLSQRSTSLTPPEVNTSMQDTTISFQLLPGTHKPRELRIRYIYILHHYNSTLG